MENNKKLKVFLDSNVFISGLYSEKGAPGLIMNNYILGRIDISISQKVLNEIIIVLKKKLPSILTLLQKFLLTYPPEIIKDPPAEAVKKWNDIINENDAAILESAIYCNPDYFITGDKHFFESPIIAEKSGLQIIKPQEFLKILTRGN
ncbi:MAG: putative toxin-antitoxin system toxin component, PIN family [Candidatus Humimicrobiaceae bacterium]